MALTSRQQTFAYLYASGTMTATEAARQAGFKCAGSYAHDLKKHPAVATEIARIRASAVGDSSRALVEHLARLEALRDMAQAIGDYGVAVAAEVQRGKAMGLYEQQGQAAPPAPDPTREDPFRQLASLLTAVAQRTE